MQIIIYNTTDPENKINKDITLIHTTTGVMRDTLNILSPEIEIKTYSNYIDNGNYCYIPELKKYYFITDKSVNTSGLVLLSLKEDVLYTYRDSIYNLSALVSRSESGDPYIDGDNIVPTSQTATQVINFTNGLSSEPTTIIITAGG